MFGSIVVEIASRNDLVWILWWSIGAFETLRDGIEFGWAGSYRCVFFVEIYEVLHFNVRFNVFILVSTLNGSTIVPR